ncbi:MAG: hypothetical protein ABIO93_32990 [Dyadobacter sp.]|uniref:hypothetical protein n=1 Tax=Dyadobacter sp. TaxID=1914288 RepID=UPI0032635BBB
MDYTGIIRYICDIFNKHSVEYMIVGGTAVALHGHFRKSTTLKGDIVDKPDLDFWYNPTYENYYNLLRALEELGKDVTEFQEEQIPDPRNSFFRFEFEDYTLDLLPSIKAPLKFRVSFSKKQVIHSEGVEISFISFDDLIEDKESLGRAKDIEDIKHLKQVDLS